MRIPNLSSVGNRSRRGIMSVSLLMLFIFGSTAAQELKKMQASIVPEEDAGSIIVRNETDAILVVYSTISNLSFDEKNRGIKKVNTPNTGVFHVYLFPGTNRIVFTAEGYLPLQVRYHIEKKTFKEVNIRPASTDERAATGILVVTSTPSKANVYVDGIKMGQQTTAQLRNVPVGPHELTVEKDQYSDFSTKIEVKENEVTSVSATLAANFAPLSIRSTPSGARLFLNNSPRGVTPYLQGKQPAGEYTLLLQNPPYYHDLESTVIVGSGTPVDLNLEMRKAYGSIIINSQPVGGKIIVNSLDEWGLTPVTRDSVISGRYSIRIERPLHAPFDTTITLDDDVMLRLNARLTPEFGTVNITSVPPGKSIFVDAIPQTGVTPISLDLGLGLHAIEIRDDLYQPFSSSVLLRAGDQKDVAATLIRKRGTVQIFPTPAEATIFFNGDSLGKSVQVLKDKETGTYTVEARLSGYQTLTQSVIVEDAKVKIVEMNMVPEIGAGTSTSITAATVGLTANFIGTGEIPGRLKAGESGTLWVAVKNSGSLPITGLALKVGLLQGGAVAGLTYLETTPVPTVAPRDEVQVPIPIAAAMALASQRAVMKVGLLDNSGGEIELQPFSLTLIGSQTVNLAINENFRIQDAQLGMALGNNNQRLNFGEAAEVSLTVENRSATTMFDVHINISLASLSRVYYLNKNERIAVGTISAGNSKQVVVGLAVSENYGRTSIPLQVSLSERTGMFDSDQVVTIPVN